MLLFLFRLIGRQPDKSVLLSTGFLLSACALVILSAITQTTTVQSNQIISQNWRPTYDLVVLPPTVKLAAGQNVPSDYLQQYNGGISVQQYRQIKQIAGIDVAAPIAYLGYVSIPTPQIAFPHRNFAPGYYKLSWTLSAFNGQKEIVEYQQNQTYHIRPCAEIYEIYPFTAGVPIPNTNVQCPPNVSPTLSLDTPDTGTFLLAAIDPVAENQLTALAQSVNMGRMLTAQDTLHPDALFKTGMVSRTGSRQSVQAVPLLIHQNLPGQIKLSGSLLQLASGTETSSQAHPTGATTIFQGDVPLVQNDPQRLHNVVLAWDGKTWQPRPASILNSIYSDLGSALSIFNATLPTGLTYQSTTAPDGSSAYSLVPTGVQGPEVAFRELRPTPSSAFKQSPDNTYYTYEALGQFSDTKIAAQMSNPLNWLPETTYTISPVTSQYDAQGKATQPATLLPTTNHAGFIAQPPLALTTLAAAQQIKGDNIISAIRIRVTGVSGANQESWKHIQQVASQIRASTNLPVVVTLGSSPASTLLYVPGVHKGQFGATQDIQPIGWVKERWLAIGASILYLQQLGATRWLLLGIILAVCFNYLVVTLSALHNSQRKQLAILSALGWRPWQLVRSFLAQALLFALVGGSAGLGIALLMVTLLGATPVGSIVIWTLPLMGIMALLSSCYPLWQIWRMQPAEIFRAGSSVALSSTGFRSGVSTLARSSWVSPLWVLVLRNLTRSRLRTVITGASLCGSALLLVLMGSSILALQQTLKGTLLGSFILLQTAIPQIASCVFALLLSFFCIVDLSLLQVQQRQQEFGLLQATGWHLGQVQRLFLQEGLLLALISTLPGALAALIIVEIQSDILGKSQTPLVALGAVLLLILEATLATLPALRRINRVNIVALMRNE